MRPTFFSDLLHSACKQLSHPDLGLTAIIWNGVMTCFAWGFAKVTPSYLTDQPPTETGLTAQTRTVIQHFLHSTRPVIPDLRKDFPTQPQLSATISGKGSVVPWARVQVPRTGRLPRGKFSMNIRPCWGRYIIIIFEIHSSNTCLQYLADYAEWEERQRSSRNMTAPKWCSFVARVPRQSRYVCAVML